jgi:hypothetical protein
VAQQGAPDGFARVKPSIVDQIVTLSYSSWSPGIGADTSRELAAQLEVGKVLLLPKLAFELPDCEKKFLDPRWSNGADKNISLENAEGELKGAAGTPAELAELRAMIARFRTGAVTLISLLFPDYEGSLRVARTSFRPVRVEGRTTSWRKDDSRLHVDAFPSRPNRGERILRVFSNVNPATEPRVWRVGSPFADVAAHFLPKIPRPLPGSAAVLQTLHITKSRRSEYDHIMLHLHDSMKADLDYQKNAPQQRVEFPPGSTWICFSDQTSHAAMSGQHMLEQTLHLPVAGLYDSERSPLRILENLTGRALV